MGVVDDRNDNHGLRLLISLFSNDGTSSEDDEEDEDDDDDAREQYFPIAARALLDNLTLHFRQYGKKSRVPKQFTIWPN